MRGKKTKDELMLDGKKVIFKGLDEAVMTAYALCVWDICSVDEVEEYMADALEFLERKYKSLTKREYIDEICEKWKDLV